MLERLEVHGFRTLVNTGIRFEPLTIMIGNNGVGKTTILDSLQLLGNFARGGIDSRIRTATVVVELAADKGNRMDTISPIRNTNEDR